MDFNDYKTIILTIDGKVNGVIDVEKSLVPEILEKANGKTLTEFTMWLLSEHGDSKFILRTACETVNLKGQN